MQSTPQQNHFTTLREIMIREQLLDREIFDRRIINAFQKTPREEFLHKSIKHLAYQDAPISIGEGSTISQPYVTAIMTQQLQIRPEDTILEVGAGSGFQAAILAQLCHKVIAIEINTEIARTTQYNLKRLGYHNIEIINADGCKGEINHAPYDKIIVTAATQTITNELANQLKDGGLLVAPIGDPHANQVLWRYRKTNGEMYLDRESIPVKFVPLQQTA
jgi:protein-L-isoaspartate(D-aspartate) O-methyltransferase